MASVCLEQGFCNLGDTAHWWTISNVEWEISIWTENGGRLEMFMGDIGFWVLNLFNLCVNNCNSNPNHKSNFNHNSKLYIYIVVNSQVYFLVFFNTLVTVAAAAVSVRVICYLPSVILLHRKVSLRTINKLWPNNFCKLFNIYYTCGRGKIFQVKVWRPTQKKKKRMEIPGIKRR